MQVLYISTAGRDDPTRASIPWHMAVNGSLEVEQRPIMLLAGDAAELVIEDTVASLQGVGVPPMAEMVAKAKDHQVTVYV